MLGMMNCRYDPSVEFYAAPQPKNSLSGDNVDVQVFTETKHRPSISYSEGMTEPLTLISASTVRAGKALPFVFYRNCIHMLAFHRWATIR